MNVKATTPIKITEKIIDFCKKISNKDPFYVEVSSAGKVGECYLNCINYVEENPGSTIIWGWTVWEGSHILELEHHSIVKLKNETYLDPTTTADGENKILFLPHLDLPPVITIIDNIGLRVFAGASYANVIYPNKIFDNIKPFMVMCSYDLEHAHKKLDIYRANISQEGSIKIEAEKIKDFINGLKF